MRYDRDRLSIVSIGDGKISDNPNEVLITYSLGSCIGVTIYDPILKIGGLFHAMLPISNNDLEKSKKFPFNFVDTAVVLLLQFFYDRGSIKKNLICKVAGGGTPLEDHGVFRIGERNYAVFKKVVWKNGLLVKGELVGGKSSKTMMLEMESGRTILKIYGKT
ncbi:MAG: chemotaxis protein CheD [Oligoflexia bacterium]|nr:chemotaxis protein CheD [Oligoflexia bacterium]